MSREKRIAFLATRKYVDNKEDAKAEVEWLWEQYPDEQPKVEVPFEAGENQYVSEQFEPGQAKEGDTCPQCNQGVLENKSGVSKKTGKAYSFTGCNNFPTCRFIPK